MSEIHEYAVLSAETIQHLTESFPCCFCFPCPELEGFSRKQLINLLREMFDVIFRGKIT